MTDRKTSKLVFDDLREIFSQATTEAKNQQDARVQKLLKPVCKQKIIQPKKVQNIPFITQQQLASLKMHQYHQQQAYLYRLQIYQQQMIMNNRFKQPLLPRFLPQSQKRKITTVIDLTKDDEPDDKKLCK